MQSYANLLPALDHFLEAAGAAHKARVVRPLERKLRKAMTAAFAKQGRLFLAGFAELAPLFESRRLTESLLPPIPHPYGVELGEAIATADWMEVFDRAAAATYSAFLQPLEATAATGLMAGATAVMADLDFAGSFSLRNPRAIQYINRHGAQNVRGINQTTRDGLRTILTQAVAEGWSYQTTAREIRRAYAGFAGAAPQQHLRSRADLIAVTESGEAYEAGSEMPVRDLQDAGFRMEKSWLTVGDNRVEQHCLDNEAAGWIPFDETFPSGHARALAHPACRCTTLYRRAA